MNTHPRVIVKLVRLACHFVVGWTRDPETPSGDARRLLVVANYLEHVARELEQIAAPHLVPTPSCNARGGAS